MKLLVTTQKVDNNDDILGFFHDWLFEFSRHYEQVTVLASIVGGYDLPSNVEVISLGKSKKTSSLSFAYRFLREAISRRKEYDAVFVHMNPEYVVVAGLFWRLWGKKVGLWYTHRAVNIKLRVAVFFANIIFSASTHSFRMSTNKLRVVGHGIMVDAFACTTTKSPNVLRIVSVGRITPIKNIEVLLRAANILKGSYGTILEVNFIGAPMLKDDQQYFEEMQKLVETLGLTPYVKFLGSIPNRELSRVYCEASLTVNMTPTGGIDKTVLESMAAKTPVFSSNEAFRAYFDRYADDLIFPFHDHEALAAKIASYRERADGKQVADFLYGQAKQHFNTTNLIEKITRHLP